MESRTVYNPWRSVTGRREISTRKNGKEIKRREGKKIERRQEGRERET